MKRARQVFDKFVFRLRTSTPNGTLTAPERRSSRSFRARRGVLTFEWIILITLLVLGLVGAYTAFRDGIIDELGDICGAVLSVDQSFETHAPSGLPCAGSWGSWQDDDAGAQIQRGRNL